MTFEEAFSAAALGDTITVSNGLGQPPAGSRAYAIWFSHNCSGPLLAKLDGPPRALRIQAVNTAAAQIAYDILDDGTHSFTLGGG